MHITLPSSPSWETSYVRFQDDDDLKTQKSWSTFIRWSRKSCSSNTCSEDDYLIETADEKSTSEYEVDNFYPHYAAYFLCFLIGRSLTSITRSTIISISISVDVCM